MSRVGFDFETHLISQALPAPPPVCITVADGEAEPALLVGQDMADVFADIIRHDHIVGHNVSFDLMVGMNAWPHLTPDIFKALDAGRVRDTAIRQKMLDNAIGALRGFVEANETDEEGEDEASETKGPPRVVATYDLASVAKRLTGRRLDKSADTWRLRYAELDGRALASWPVEAVRYAIDDSVATLDVHDAQEDHASGLDVLADEANQVRAAFALALASKHGMRTDPAFVEALDIKVGRAYAKTKKRLQRFGFVRPDSRRRDGTIKEGSRNTKVAAEWVDRVYTAGKKDTPRTEKGKISLSKDVLRDAPAGRGKQILRCYGQLAKQKKTLGTDIPLLASGVELPIHAYFEVYLQTGRTSCSPNLQNFNNYGGVRECFIPSAGHAFLEADYEQLELSMLAQTCIDLFGYSKLAELINSGIDVHSWVAARIAGVTYEEVLKAKGKGEKYYHYRQLAKALNFGLPGGLGARTFILFAWAAYQIRLVPDAPHDEDAQLAEAYKLRDLWLEMFPEVKELFAYASDIAESSDALVVLPRSRRWRGGCTYTQACNTHFQGPGADVAKKAFYRVTREAYCDPKSGLWLSRPCNFVHDSILTDTPWDRVAEAGARLEAVMVETAKENCPDVKLGAVCVAMDRWSGLAKRIVDAQGRLQVWRYPIAS